MSRWSKEELMYLKDNYQFIENEVLAKNLNHSISSIVTKANRYLNLKKFKICKYCEVDINNLANNAIVCDNCRIEHIKNSKKEYYLKNRGQTVRKKLWTKEEIEYLKKNYSFKKNEELAQHLNHSIDSIIAKANHYLKLKKLKFCKLCGIDITNLNRNAVACKSCFSTYNKNYKKEWAFNNKERLIKKRLEWNLKNHERKKEMDRLWRIKNREKKIVNGKAYYSKIKALKPTPLCIDCKKSLIGETHKTKRCKDCNKLNQILNLKKYRSQNKEHYRELSRKYVKNKRDKENQRRLKLGLPLIGNNFKKEQELLLYIKTLFSNEKIIYHDRSALGNSWELDIFLPELNLAFEYHGRQHFDFKSTHYWKTYEEFESQKLRDELKKILCKINNITLIEFTCYEKLSEQLVLSKLHERNILTNQNELVDYNRIQKIEIKRGNQRRY